MRFDVWVFDVSYSGHRRREVSGANCPHFKHQTAFENQAQARPTSENGMSAS